jgi:phosphocarrier protein HPr
MQFTYIVKDFEGLHARPAGMLVKCAQGFSSQVSISLRGKTANVKRLFAVMGLGVKHNDMVTFQIEGEDEASACTKLKKFCEENI